MNSVPKEVKKLRKLNVIDLRANKLWYVSQVVAVKDLVKVRVEELGEEVEIRLEGNTVMKTNEKTVQKLLYVSKSLQRSTNPKTSSIIAIC